jgi:hypothetical protein
VNRVAIGTLAITAILAGCGGSSTAKPAPAKSAAAVTSPAPATTGPSIPAASAMLPVGRSFVVEAPEGWRARVTVSSITKQTTSPSGTAVVLEPGHIYVVAHVSYQCLAGGPCGYSQLGDWYAIDPSGSGSTLATNAKEPSLGSGEFATKSVVSGYVTMDATAKANELTYGPGGDPVASWAIG